MANTSFVDPIEDSQDSILISNNSCTNTSKNIPINKRVRPVYYFTWPKEISEDPNDTSIVILEHLSRYINVENIFLSFNDIFYRDILDNEKLWLLSQNLINDPFCKYLQIIKREDAEKILKAMITDSPFPNFKSHKIVNKKVDRPGRKEPTGIRYEQTRRRSMKNAAEFNKNFIQDRVQERLYYWDLQTMQIHVPKKPYTVREYPETVRYPVPVIAGQYCDYYKEYNSEELKFLPLNKALYTKQTLQKTLKSSSIVRPPKIASYNLKFSKIAQIAREKEAAEILSVPKKEPIIEKVPVIEEPPVELAKYNDKQIKCTICGQMTPFYVKCSDCTRQGHPKCLSLPDSMVSLVKTYEWSCMDCKHCLTCGESEDEDAMMFCDQCDRGFHSYCVGLKAIPDGQWNCPVCLGKPIGSPIGSPIRNTPTKSPARGRGKRKLETDSKANVKVRRTSTVKRN